MNLALVLFVPSEFVAGNNNDGSVRKLRHKDDLDFFKLC